MSSLCTWQIQQTLWSALPRTRGRPQSTVRCGLTSTQARLSPPHSLCHPTLTPPHPASACLPVRLPTKR
eukprot:5205308-Prymnesium_polylepis.2